MSSSSARLPSLVVRVNGAQVLGAVEAEVRSTNHYAADSFSARLAFGLDPEFDAVFWASASGVAIDVAMSLDGGATSVSLIQGAVDRAEIDVLRQTVQIEGRDLSAALIEARTQETFANRTSSEIATLLAQRHGLQPDVTQTTTLVGRYYAAEHDSITLDQFSRATTEWDLLVFLARQEQFDVYVQGSILSFNPPSQAQAASLAPAELISLRAERSLTLSGSIEVTVKSWNTRQQRAFTQTASSASANDETGPPRVYVYVVPNLTTDQAVRYAQQRLAELTRHERTLSLTMPGELALAPRTAINLQGTGTAFDQAYQIDSIDRRLSADSGFIQVVRASNLVSDGGATPPADTVGSVTG